VHVRFAKSESDGVLADSDLDALADLLIAIDDVVTVRVEQADQPTVYRIDIDTTTQTRAAALAAAPLGIVREKLGLVSEVVALTAERSSSASGVGEDLAGVENPSGVERGLDRAHRGE
jgi:hypothetical protein